MYSARAVTLKVCPLTIVSLHTCSRYVYNFSMTESSNAKTCAFERLGLMLGHLSGLKKYPLILSPGVLLCTQDVITKVKGWGFIFCAVDGWTKHFFLFRIQLWGSASRLRRHSWCSRPLCFVFQQQVYIFLCNRIICVKFHLNLILSVSEFLMLGIEADSSILRSKVGFVQLKDICQAALWSDCNVLLLLPVMWPPQLDFERFRCKETGTSNRLETSTYFQPFKWHLIFALDF